MLDGEVSAEQLRGMLRLRQAQLQSQIAADTSRLAQVEARLSIIEMEGAMPAGDIQVKRIPAVRVAELTATAAGLEPAFISPVIQPLYAELGARLARAVQVLARWIDANGYRSPKARASCISNALPVTTPSGSPNYRNHSRPDDPRPRPAVARTRKPAPRRHGPQPAGAKDPRLRPAVR